MNEYKFMWRKILEFILVNFILRNDIKFIKIPEIWIIDFLKIVE